MDLREALRIYEEEGTETEGYQVEHEDKTASAKKSSPSLFDKLASNSLSDKERKRIANIHDRCTRGFNSLFDKMAGSWGGGRRAAREQAASRPEPRIVTQGSLSGAEHTLYDAQHAGREGTAAVSTFNDIRNRSNQIDRDMQANVERWTRDSEERARAQRRTQEQRDQQLHRRAYASMQGAGRSMRDSWRNSGIGESFASGTRNTGSRISGLRNRFNQTGA